MFETFEHKADIGVRGIGATEGKAFEECAKAMFGIIADLKKVEAEKFDGIELKAENLEELLVKFLNELLFLKDAKGMLYSKFKVYITSEGPGFALHAKVGGGKIDAAKHSLRGDVKAATYHQLRVAKEGGGFVAQCVVDV
jgi:SHS2 domain-containing protein